MKHKISFTIGHITISETEYDSIEIKSTKCKTKVMSPRSSLIDTLFKLFFTDENIIKEHQYGRKKFRKMKQSDYTNPLITKQ
jgi:hypothetical protein